MKKDKKKIRIGNEKETKKPKKGGGAKWSNWSIRCPTLETYRKTEEKKRLDNMVGSESRA